MNLKNVYRKIAKANGVSIVQVKKEMQKAIDDAYTNPNKSLGERYQQDKIPCRGTRPTTLEVVSHIAGEIAHNHHDEK